MRPALGVGDQNAGSTVAKNGPTRVGEEDDDKLLTRLGVPDRKRVRLGVTELDLGSTARVWRIRGCAVMLGEAEAERVPVPRDAVGLSLRA